MRKLIVLLTLFAIFTSSVAFASIYGVLSGNVVDAEGVGVIGASVLIEGTSRGTYVKSRDGSFSVTNITAGNYVVKVRFTGKQEYRANVRISADQTTKIQVTLKDDAVTTDTITVTAEAEAKKVDDGTIGTIHTIGGAALTNTTGTNVAEVVAMSAGVSSTDAGYAIRGSRSSETQIRLDGLNMGDQFSGGFGGAGSTYFPMVSAYATEEVQVITGNFAAQYGDAQGGIVNSVMKTGRTDQWEGHVVFRTDVPFLAGSQSSGTEVMYADGRYKLIDGGEGADYIMSGRMDFDIGFGGPLAFINDKTTFYLNAVNTYVPQGAHYDLRDVNGTSTYNSPLQGTWSKNFEGRIAYGITNDIKLVLGAKYGVVNAYGSNNYRYDSMVATPYINPATGEIDPINGVPTSNGVTAEEGKISGTNVFVPNVFARLNHTLTDRSYYEFTLAWGANNTERGRRVAGSSLNYFTGFDLMQPTDDWIVNANRWTPSTVVAGRNVGDRVVDWAAPVSSVTSTKDSMCTSTWYDVNPFTGYYEGARYSSGTLNPYGMAQLSYSGGTEDFEFRYGNFFNVGGDYNLYGVKSGDFTHTIKAGFEGTYYIMDRHYNSEPFSGSPVYDIYTSKLGGNIYAENDKTYQKTSKEKTQFKLGMYVQDQITWKGIVFNPGLRLDVMNPMSEYRVINAEHPQFIPISSDTGFADAAVKYRISPRISINYPVTENSFISMSYGQFFQSPAANYLYYYHNLDVMSAGLLVGDPNMEAQQTNQYQVSYQNQITDQIAIKFNVYYKDIYNQLGLAAIMTNPEAYYQYSVSEYGTSKGFEVAISKSLSDYFGFELNYSLAYLTVTSTDENSNNNLLRDPYTNLLTFPLAPYFSSNDVRHTFKGSLFFAMGSDEGPELFGMYPLQNLQITFEPTFQTGRPYTRQDLGGMEISDKNVYRLPSVFTVDMQLSKSFNLKDWFGESMGKSTVTFFVNVLNVLNNRSATGLYTTTGEALDNGSGLNQVFLGNFGQIPWYKEATYANSASYTPDQYDQYGNRLYNVAADTDGNGIVTQQEKYDAYKKYYEEVTIQARSLFQVPIRVRAGLAIQF